ncbi:DUF7260 family protein [Natronorubrum texcoconense]|uniref:DUF7260 domain-containing protein n=1 Tax=Natronorubrum texcoconense TaxID=1095776 RepID=A0A1G9CQC1_9EURY|nr:hypothetical protein [Natronorubrum texcoconense]SDK53798.1 hypothetical protein SAMN04515672_3274 [Natronorubrum texcoconense]
MTHATTPLDGAARSRTVHDEPKQTIEFGVVTVGLFVVWLVWVSDGHSPTSGLGTDVPSIALGALVASSSIPAARIAVDREREQLMQERDAFHQFATEVDSIPVSADVGGGLPLVGVEHANTVVGELDSVRAAYRECIMGLEHFDQLYGEALYDNMASELSADVATAVVCGDQFSLPVKRAAIQRATEASLRRERLLQTIDSERDSLDCAERQLRAIASDLEAEPSLSEATLTELFDHERRLSRWKDRCERLLRSRQQHIHAESMFRSNLDLLFVQSYLYAELETDFPVLDACVRLHSRLEARQQAIHRAITYR